MKCPIQLDFDQSLSDCCLTLMREGSGAAAHALQVGQCGIELESRGRTATKDWNGADTQPVNAFRTLTDIGHTLYIGLENVPWSRPYAGMAESRDGTRERRSARLNARVALAATFSRKVCAPRRTCRA